MATRETREMVLAATAACEDKKGEDIRLLELDPADAGFTDFFLIASGTNTRQVVSISDEIEIRMKKQFGTYPNSVEGRRAGEWVLMDYVDFVVHIFLEEKRAFYDIERLRKSATPVDAAAWRETLTAKVVEARKKSAVKSASAKKSPAKKAAAKKSSVPVKKVAAAAKTVTKKASKKAVTKTKVVSKKAPKTMK